MFIYCSEVKDKFEKQLEFLKKTNKLGKINYSGRGFEPGFTWGDFANQHPIARTTVTLVLVSCRQDAKL